LDHDHEVNLFAARSTLAFPQALAVPCKALQGDFRSIMPSGDLGQRSSISQQMRALGQDVKGFIADNSAAWLRAVGEDATRSDAILFSGLALGIGSILREELHKTTVRLAFQPLTPTREFCATGLPALPLPGWLNLWTYRLIDYQLQSLFAASSQRARLEVFGTRGGAQPVGDVPTFYGMSNELVARPADWPQDHIVCGQWLNAMTEWQPPQDLLDFLGDEPPLYVGFGSVSAYVSGTMLKAIIEAVAGRRVVFSPGWGNIDRSVLPDNFFIARDVPHEWLFPRVSLTIHHGGAGTTHTAARAGVPQVILPLAADQFFWSGRMVAQGVAPRTSRRAASDAATVAKMIAFAQLASTRRRARELGDAMAREDGVHRAVRELEALVKRHAARRSYPRTQQVKSLVPDISGGAPIAKE
jgi:hypothetical protein